MDLHILCHLKILDNESTEKCKKVYRYKILSLKCVLVEIIEQIVFLSKQSVFLSKQSVCLV